MQRRLKLFSISQKIWNGKYFYSSNIQPVPLSFTLYGSTKVLNNEAPPIILLHGLLGSKNNWRSFCRNLQKNVITNRRIFALDARNHGQSPHTDEHSYLHMAEDIVHFLKQQNIKNAAIMGHCMGGKVMMAVALKYPKFVERAIFIDISPKNLPRSFSIRKKKLFDVMQSIQIPSNYGMTKARILVEKQLQTVIDPATASYVTHNFKKLDNGKYAWKINVKALQNNYKNVIEFPPELYNLQFNKPVLFIGGMKSEFIKKEDWPNIQKIFPNSKLFWVNAGHLVHMERPVETTNLISEFLSQN